MSRLSMPERYREMVREAVSVLAAILIAFGLDAWWDARKERADMLDALDAVRVEVARNVVQMDSVLAVNGPLLESAAILIAMRPEQVDELTEEEISLLSYYSELQFATLEFGAVTAFVEGGFLQAVEDRELRSTVAGLTQLQDELEEERILVAEAGLDGQRIYFDLVAEAGPDMSVLMAGEEAPREWVRLLVSNPRALGATLREITMLGVYNEELARVRDQLAVVLEDLALALDE